MKTVYLSIEAHQALTSYLTQQGYAIEHINHQGVTYHPVSTHPDIIMCKFGLWENAEIFPGNPEKLQPSYPGNIIYNAVCTEKYFIHNLKHTDPELMAAAKVWKGSHGDISKDNASFEDLNIIDVPQGYARCCCLPVNDTSFITSDEGIGRALKSAGAEVLMIEKGHIELTGFDYGFIGGCAGHIEKNTIIFNGNLSAHPNYHEIANFIHERNIDIVYFEDYPLADIGSIITL